MAELVKILSGLNRVNMSSEYFKCEVQNGKNSLSVGDYLWFSDNGHECEIHSDITRVMSINELNSIFDESSVRKIINKFGC